MTIQQMHETFRTIGQQMGMQSIRAILPEEIDVFLNLAINEKVREIVYSNVVNSSQKVIFNNTSPINALRTLYMNAACSEKVEDETHSFVVQFDNVAMFYTGFTVRYNEDFEEDIHKYYNCRIIEPDELENTLNDYCNSASDEYPICVYVTGNPSRITIYCGSKTPKSIFCKFIKNPSTVSLDDEIDCDLPKYLHTDIVQLAVQKYFNSVGSTTHNVE